MKKIIGGLLACACVWLASPVLAATITVNDVVDVGSDYARYFLNQSNHIVGFTTPTTSVEAWDVVEGTVRFTGGHVKATDLSSFTVYGKVQPYGVMADVLQKEFALLDVNGNEFGTKKLFPWYYNGLDGNYYETAMLGAENSKAMEPFDVYGIRYRVKYGGMDIGVGYRTGIFRFEPTIVGGDYAEGEAFAAAVPEPSSWAMMALGFAGLELAMRRRRRAGGAIVLA